MFGTTDKLHPGSHYTMVESGPVYIGGKLDAISLPSHYDFVAFRSTYW